MNSKGATGILKPIKMSKGNMKQPKRKDEETKSKNQENISGEKTPLENQAKTEPDYLPYIPETKDDNKQERMKTESRPEEIMQITRDIANKTIDAIRSALEKHVEETEEIHISFINSMSKHLEKHGILAASPLGTFLIETYNLYYRAISMNTKYFINLFFEMYKSNLSGTMQMYQNFVTEFLKSRENYLETQQNLINIYQDMSNQWLAFASSQAKQFSENIKSGIDITMNIMKQYNSLLDKQFSAIKDIQEKASRIIEQWLNWWK